MLAEQLLDGEAEGLVRKAIELALAGDAGALRLCLERILPARRERPVLLELPRVSNAGDAVSAMASILNATGTGDLTPSEAGELTAVLGSIVRAIETTELERRVRVLEEKAIQGAKTR